MQTSLRAVILGVILGICIALGVAGVMLVLSEGEDEAPGATVTPSLAVSVALGQLRDDGVSFAEFATRRLQRECPDAPRDEVGFFAVKVGTTPQLNYHVKMTHTGPPCLGIINIASVDTRLRVEAVSSTGHPTGDRWLESFFEGESP